MNDWLNSLVSISLKSTKETEDINVEEFLCWLRSSGDTALDANIVKHFADVVQADAASPLSTRRVDSAFKGGRNDVALSSKNPDLKPTMVNQIDSAMQRAKQLILAASPIDENGGRNAWFSFLMTQVAMLSHVERCLEQDPTSTIVVPFQEADAEHCSKEQNFVASMLSDDTEHSILTCEQLDLLRRSGAVTERDDGRLHVAATAIRDLLYFRVQFCIGSRALIGAMMEGTDNYTDRKKKLFNLALMRQLAQFSMQKIEESYDSAPNLETLLRDFRDDSPELISRFALSQETMEQDIVNFTALRGTPSAVLRRQVAALGAHYQAWRRDACSEELERIRETARVDKALRVKAETAKKANAMSGLAKRKKSAKEAATSSTKKLVSVKEEEEEEETEEDDEDWYTLQKRDEKRRKKSLQEPKKEPTSESESTARATCDNCQLLQQVYLDQIESLQRQLCEERAENSRLREENEKLEDALVADAI